MKCSCCLSCNSDNAVAVYTVGSDLILKNYIVQSQYFYCICSCLDIIVENINSILRCFRVHISCRTKFFDGTHHTVTRYSAEFSFFNLDPACNTLSRFMTSCNASSIQYNRNFCSLKYIGCTCYDLNCLSSHIHLTDHQLVCIRVLLDLLDLTNHNLVKVSIQLFKTFYFCSCQCHCICIFLCCHIKLRHIRFYP